MLHKVAHPSLPCFTSDIESPFFSLIFFLPFHWKGIMFFEDLMMGPTSLFSCSKDLAFFSGWVMMKTFQKSYLYLFFGVLPQKRERERVQQPKIVLYSRS